MSDNISWSTERQIVTCLPMCRPTSASICVGEEADTPPPPLHRMFPTFLLNTAAGRCWGSGGVVSEAAGPGGFSASDEPPLSLCFRNPGAMGYCYAYAGYGYGYAYAYAMAMAYAYMAMAMGMALCLCLWLWLCLWLCHGAMPGLFTSNNLQFSN